MNTVYAIKDRKTGLYYSKSPTKGTGWWGELVIAVFYRTEEGAQRVIDGKTVSPRAALAVQRGDPYIVPIQLTEMYAPQRVEPIKPL